jgi:transposase
MKSLSELLREADAKGLSDQEIATITGRNYSTVWRWRQKPDTSFVFDEGIRKLIRTLEQRPAMNPSMGKVEEARSGV